MGARSTNRKTIIVTGASSGLGAAIARALAPVGHQLALVARREDRLKEIAEEIESVGGEAFILAEDLADPEAAERIVAATVAQFGQIDALINNAGFGLPRYQSECDPYALHEQITVNFAAPILLTRHALPHLLESRGTVVNIGSAVAAVANPILGVYGSTKAGLLYWNDALRRELRRRGVSVSLVDMGPVSTEFFEAVRRRSHPEWNARPLGIDLAPDGVYNAMRDRPPLFLTTTAENAARRIAGLLDHPQRRLRIPGRLVWPFRIFGALLNLCPALADAAVSAMIRRVEGEEARTEPPVTAGCRV